MDRYSFIAVDLHHLLLAGLPAHTKLNPAFVILSGSDAALDRGFGAVCTENLIRVDEAMESPKLAE